MIDVILGFLVSFNIIAISHLYFKSNAIEKAIKDGIDNVEIEIPSLDELREDISESLHAVLSQMHTPTFLDHIGGAIGGLIQAKAARTIQNLEIPDVIEENIH